MKALEEMTTDELAALFPIILVPHQDAWQGWFMRESARLRALLPLEQIYRLTHVGSTAIEGIWAKPTVDMLLEATDEAAFLSLATRLPDCGYICMRQDRKSVV